MIWWFVTSENMIQWFVTSGKFQFTSNDQTSNDAVVRWPTPWISHLLFLWAAFWLLALSPSFFFASRAWKKKSKFYRFECWSKSQFSVPKNGFASLEWKLSHLLPFVHLCLLHLAQFLVVALFAKQMAVVEVRWEVSTCSVYLVLQPMHATWSRELKDWGTSIAFRDS